MIRDTSRLAYETVSIGERQADVLRAIKTLGECTDVEIATFLGWTINRVTPRRGELVDLGEIESCGKKKGPTGRSATVWRLTPPKPLYHIESTGQGAFL